MSLNNQNLKSYSPDIFIYLEIGTKKIALADVLFDSATLYEVAEVSPNTKASLVFNVDGSEDREEVVLEKGISKEDSLISFSYVDPARLNGRHF